MDKPDPDAKAENIKNIGNKIKRNELFQKLKKEKKKKKRQDREKRKREEEELGENAPPKKVPRTLDNTRVEDETMICNHEEQVAADLASDEFANYFQGQTPRLMLTTCKKPTARMFELLRELMWVFPRSYYFKRGPQDVKQMVQYAIDHEFTELIMINEDRKKPNALLHVHLPEGPTALYKLSSVVLGKKIHNHARPSKHRPELILNNFNTRLGHRIGRMLAACFPQDPEFLGRRVVTLHNQRDFIFFRQHRYIFDNLEIRDKTKCRLQEIGPRFTLKLRSLQTGTFDPRYGEFEWVHDNRRESKCRRKFAL
eukprot:gnl/Spiro4/7898_TR4162_c0_g1_i1.p1 gnl/Spiro4/7898_TR4162_c0_g1~~gnl/Spiro4/7898_TR4162_c0_g1_i1.p1  ORF type:complete len:312 (-),score=63.13 gnl/Spiro4/7898_TR4162_c0_g1_i1:41-976(-)